MKHLFKTEKKGLLLEQACIFKGKEQAKICRIRVMIEINLKVK